MREIKFDAIYKPTGEHFKPIEINFNDNTVTGKFDGSNVDWCHFSLDGIRGDVILRQYTGLKDKNGKEIYEGDIIKAIGYKEFIELVEYRGTSFTAQGDSLSDFSNLCDGNVEVIGNIYEHPHLLKEVC